MANTPVPTSLGYGTSAWDKYVAAQKKAEDALEERNGRLFDPVMLAMAQGFLAPTKTGGFGESLGNVAGAVAPAQAAEEKRTMDMAKMRMEMAQQQLQTEVQGQAAKEEQEYWARKRGVPPTTPPAPPATAQQPQPPQPVQLASAGATLPAGALTQAAPSAAPVAPPAPPVASAGALAQAAPQAPQAAPQMPAGQQLFPPAPEGWTPQEDEIARSMRLAGKKPFEVEQAIDKMRRENMVVKENQATDLRTGKIFTPPDPTPTEVRIPGAGTYTTTKTMAGRLAGAQARNDAEEYWRIADMIKNGISRPASKTETPPPANATPTGAAPAGAPAQTGMLTKEQEEASAARKKEMAVGGAKSENTRRDTLPDDIKRYDSLARSADSLYKIVDENPRGFGTFDKPGVLPAIGVLVRDGIRANKVNVDMGGWEDAIRGANPKIKESDINAVRLGAAEQANIELNYANMFLKGTGPITEGERAIVRRAGAGNVSMNPETLKLRAKAVGKRASYERDDLNAYREFVTKSPDSTYLDYMNSPKFKSLYADYDKEMRGLAGLTSTKQQKGKPDLNAAGANVDKQTD